LQAREGELLLGDSPSIWIIVPFVFLHFRSWLVQNLGYHAE
jgi:hypothetical protein